MRNKKGFVVEDWLPTLLMIVVLIGVYFILLLPTSAIQNKNKEIATFQTLDIDSDQHLIDFLRLPIDENSNVADTIQLYFSTKEGDLFVNISDKANEYFPKTKLDTKTTSWSLKFSPSKGDELTLGAKKDTGPKFVTRYNSRLPIAKTAIPTQNNETVEITLLHHTKKQK
jgi:hypothetical protein|tara:strand:- start:88 stop:597 length:510 start_codon:yes stop_codon:yes gene_type:complete